MFKYFAVFLCGSALFAHPMGNFSVSHYSKLQPGSQGVELHYVLDLAEIPTFELLRSWKVDRWAPSETIQNLAAAQAKQWVSHLAISVNGYPVSARLESTRANLSDGAGNLPILRVDMRARINATGGNLTYEDSNYPERAGWKEIVIATGSGISLVRASQPDRELSNALAQYPSDPTVAPPQDLRAELRWNVPAPLRASLKSKQTRQASVNTIPQPRLAPVPAPPVTMTTQGAQPGAIARGDFLSRLLHQRELSFRLIVLALIAAFGLGAAHALTPGHGKTIVAAYLVGSRGTLKHAAFLGAMVTFTHTISVFALGLATLFLFRFIVPEKITVFLGALSGITIVVLGAFMLYRRLRHAGHSHAQSHSHEHPHTHEHTHHAPGHHHHDADHHHHDADHDHHHHHGHKHGAHVHSHGPGGHVHSHVPEELSWGGLVALGASGGLVPCESALILLLGAIALGRVGLGLMLLLSFSLGLALVLMLIGILVLYAKNLLPKGRQAGGHPTLRWVSIASPAVVMVVGVLMTAASLGWIQSKWMVG